MRFYKTRRLRIVSAASILLVLTGLPVVLGLTRHDASAFGPPAVVVAYASGLSSMAVAGLVSFGLALAFGAWLLAGKRQAIGRKYYAAARGRALHTLKETGRTFAIVLGAAGVIVGSLVGLYAAMLHARPDLAMRMDLPLLTADLAIPGLLGGGALYVLGRLGR